MGVRVGGEGEGERKGERESGVWEGVWKGGRERRPGRNGGKGGKGLAVVWGNGRDDARPSPRGRLGVIVREQSDI